MFSFWRHALQIVGRGGRDPGAAREICLTRYSADAAHSISRRHQIRIASRFDYDVWNCFLAIRILAHVLAQFAFDQLCDRMGRKDQL